MFALDPLSLGSLLVLASSGACSAPKPAAINVIPRTAEVQVITNYTLGQLQNTPMDTVNPHSFGALSVTQGFMTGKISMIPRVQLDYSQDTRAGTVCLWYDRVDINISIDPKIYIGKEIYQNRCMGKATLDHETKHVMVDRKIVNKYAAIMGRKIYDGLKARGFTAGPVPAAMAQDTADRMQRTVFQIVEHEYKKMELERIDLQRGIDTTEEYAYVDSLCPDFKDPPESLKAYFKKRYQSSY